MEAEYYEPAPLTLSQEISEWIELLIDHARFMGNGFNTTEEKLFAEANNFSREFIALSNRNWSNIEQDQEDLDELQEEVNEFIVFKKRVTRRIENCQTLSILPSALIDHIMKEAIFFSGILARIQDEPRPTWGELGLPNNRNASTAPQAYIPRLRMDINHITWEELLFWLEINYEHANVLALYFRPRQSSLRRETVRWGRRIQRLYDDVLSSFNRSNRNPDIFLEPARRIIKDWINFLKNLYRQLNNCTIPGEQMNIWPRVVDHMIREGVYFLGVLGILIRLY